MRSADLLNLVINCNLKGTQFIYTYFLKQTGLVNFQFTSFVG